LINQGATFQFLDVTAQVGILEDGPSFGAGSWGDFNGDGSPDLWLGNHATPAALYLNNADGTFTNITTQIWAGGIEGDTHGAAWADIDADGDQDLTVLVGGAFGQGSKPSKVFINGQGQLADQAVNLGLDYPLARGRTPMWLDWNSDGMLDLLHVNLYREDVPSKLFTQVAPLSFQPITANYKFLPPESSQVSALADFNADGHLDLLIPGIRDSWVVMNLTTQPFQDLSTSIRLPSIDLSRDIAVADFDGDLKPDIYTSRHFAGPNHVKNNDIFLSWQGDFIRGCTMTSSISSKAVAMGDFDNDMDIDLYLVLSGRNNNKDNIILANNGDGTFALSAMVGDAKASPLGIGDAASVVDYDGDGFLDLLVTNGDGNLEFFQGKSAPVQLFRNLGNSNHWLEIDLQGTASNIEGIGAIVTLTAGGIQQIRYQVNGMHNATQDHSRIHFGLSSHLVADAISIQWPSGIVQTLTHISADQLITVIEP